jgi:hypothetical protein
VPGSLRQKKAEDDATFCLNKRRHLLPPFVVLRTRHRSLRQSVYGTGNLKIEVEFLHYHRKTGDYLHTRREATQRVDSTEMNVTAKIL